MSRDASLESDLLAQLVRAAPAPAARVLLSEHAELGDDGHGVPLPEVGPPPDLPLEDVVLRRRSGRWVAGASLPGSALGALLMGLPAAAPSAGTELAPVLFPLVFAVDGVPVGAYRYAPSSHTLLHVASLTREEARRDLLSQHDHADAAVVILQATPLTRWLQVHGDAGYRFAIVQNGWLSDRLYLRAEALGLRYTASGGFAPCVAASWLGLHELGLEAVFAFVVGTAGG